MGKNVLPLDILFEFLKLSLIVMMFRSRLLRLFTCYNFKTIRRVCLLLAIAFTFIELVRHTNHIFKLSLRKRELYHATDVDIMSEKTRTGNVNYEEKTRHKTAKGWLTIGLCSVSRNGGEYLLKTLKSIVSSSSTEERAGVTVVICLVDFDRQLRQRTFEVISRQFHSYIVSGFILVIQPNAGIYPPLVGLRQTFNDSPEHVKWRSKQVIDYAFLFHFSKNISRYYLILEDDVLCLKGFLTEIKNAVNALNEEDRSFRLYHNQNNAQVLQGEADMIFDGPKLDMNGPNKRLIDNQNVANLAKPALNAQKSAPFKWLQSYWNFIFNAEKNMSKDFSMSVIGTNELKQDLKWLKIVFSNFLIIGTVFESTHLDPLAKFLRMFYSSQPVDFLILKYFNILAPGNDSDRLFEKGSLSLFQHAGCVSSLRNKTQELKDVLFPGDFSELYVRNPSAHLLTTVRSFSRFRSPASILQLPYTTNNSFFWGIPKRHDTYDIIFDKPIKIRRFVVVTGLPYKADILKAGSVLFSSNFIRFIDRKRADCGKFKLLSKFVNGIANVTHFGSNLVQCLRILVNESQVKWLIIRKISVFL
ncbi:hypothetical protein CHUAL_011466 [Chamberlinius hualienensis]